MTTEIDKITVTVDGVTYERGEELTAIPLGGAPFFEDIDLCRFVEAWEVFDGLKWVTSCLIDSQNYYAAIPIPQQPKEPEWVEVALDNAVFIGEALRKAISQCLKAKEVKIEWMSGEVSYQKRGKSYCQDDYIFSHDGIAMEHYLITAFLAGCKVWVKEGEA